MKTSENIKKAGVYEIVVGKRAKRVRRIPASQTGSYTGRFFEMRWSPEAVILSPSLRSRVNSAKDLRLARREILRCAQDDTSHLAGSFPKKPTRVSQTGCPAWGAGMHLAARDLAPTRAHPPIHPSPCLISPPESSLHVAWPTTPHVCPPRRRLVGGRRPPKCSGTGRLGGCGGPLWVPGLTVHSNLSGGQASFAPPVPITSKKIVSYRILLVLCFATLLFALLLLQVRTAPALAHVSVRTAGPSITSSPSQGPPGTTISVQGSGIVDSAGNPLTGNVVTFGYGPSSGCGSSPTYIGLGSNVKLTSGILSGTLTWPTSGTTAGNTYTVCVSIIGSSPPVLPASSFMVTAPASVSVDTSSYKVGDIMTVSGSDFPDRVSVTVKLQSADGKTTATLGTIITLPDGSFDQDYVVPAHPTNAVVVIVTYGNGQKATSSTFTVNPKKPKSTPTPTPPPPTPTPISPPPVVLAATPTLAPVPTDTPTAVPADTPTPAPSPTVAPASTAVPVVVNYNTSPFGSLLGGRLPLILAIGLGTLIALGILFMVGRVLLRRYLSPAPLPKMPPSGALPWSRSREESLHGNTMMNDVPFAQMMPYDSPFPPGNGEFAPGPWNSGGAPANVVQEPFPPNDWFAPPD